MLWDDPGSFGYFLALALTSLSPEFQCPHLYAGSNTYRIVDD